MAARQAEQQETLPTTGSRTALERVAGLYDRNYPQRFVLDGKGLHLAYPVVDLSPLHHATSTTQTDSELNDFIQQLPPLQRTFFTYLPVSHDMKASLVHAVDAARKHRGTIHGYFGATEAIGQLLMQGTEDSFREAKNIVDAVGGSAANFGHIVTSNLSRHHHNFAPGLFSAGEEIEDQISYAFTRMITGDPVESVANLEQEGFSKKDGEAGMDVDYVARVIKAATHEIIEPMHLRKPNLLIRVISGTKVDFITDAKPIIDSFGREHHGYPMDELAVYSAAGLVDLFSYKIPSPGIDGPSLAPWLRMELRAKQILTADLMYRVFAGELQGTPVGDNLRKGFGEVARATLLRNSSEVRRMQKAAEELTAKALVAQGVMRDEFDDNNFRPVTREEIEANNGLSADEKDTLIMSYQLLSVYKAAEQDLYDESGILLRRRIFRKDANNVTGNDAGWNLRRGINGQTGATEQAERLLAPEERVVLAQKAMDATNTTWDDLTGRFFNKEEPQNDAERDLFEHLATTWAPHDRTERFSSYADFQERFVPPWSHSQQQ